MSEWNDDPMIVCGVELQPLPEEMQVVEVILLVKGVDEEGMTYFIRHSDGLLPPEGYGMMELFAERMKQDFLEDTQDE